MQKVDDSFTGSNKKARYVAVGLLLGACAGAYYFSETPNRDLKMTNLEEEDPDDICT